MNRIAVLFVLSLSFACASSSASKTASPPSSVPSSQGAFATIEARSGSKLVGSARFSHADGGGITAHIVIANASPGDHGVHIHEKGDCSDDKAASAGAHFNPSGAPHHGGTVGADRHGGDLGNITADASGNGSLDINVSGLNLNGDEHGIIGRSIVVHEKADDLHTDPAGNSGSRIGCGVIQPEK